MQSAELTGQMRKPKSEGHGDASRVRIQEFAGFLDHLQGKAMLYQSRLQGLTSFLQPQKNYGQTQKCAC